MRIVVLYATTDGQTRKIARFAAERLTGLGHAVTLLDAEEDAPPDLAGFDGAVLAGSLHIGGFQKALRRAAHAQAAALNAMPTLFLPVSLSAAGDDPEDWAGLKECLARFLDDTGWQPGRIEHVAGAFRFSRYDALRRWAMRRIARDKGQKIDLKGDTEYTDWNALAAVLADWARS